MLHCFPSQVSIASMLKRFFVEITAILVFALASAPLLIVYLNSLLSLYGKNLKKAASLLSQFGHWIRGLVLPIIPTLL